MSGQADVTALPFDDDTFDTVLMNSVVYFVPEKQKVFDEVCRVLKPGGLLVFNGPGSYTGDEIFGLVPAIIAAEYEPEKDLYASFPAPLT